MTVQQIMTRHVITVKMDDSLLEVKELFNKHKFHHLMVTDSGRLVGVVSDRDLLKNISPFIDGLSERPADAATLRRRVHQMMTRTPVSIRPETLVSDAAALMIEHSVTCLPVINAHSRLVGIITCRDLLRTIVSSAATGALVSSLNPPTVRHP